MVLTTILFVGVTATVRYLEGEVPAPQAAFLRYAIGTLFLIPSLISLTKIKPDKPLLQKFVLRGLVQDKSILCLDEPTASISEKSSQDLLIFLQKNWILIV